MSLADARLLVLRRLQCSAYKAESDPVSTNRPAIRTGSELETVHIAFRDAAAFSFASVSFDIDWMDDHLVDTGGRQKSPERIWYGL